MQEYLLKHQIVMAFITLLGASGYLWIGWLFFNISHSLADNYAIPSLLLSILFSIVAGYLAWRSVQISIREIKKLKEVQQ